MNTILRPMNIADYYFGFLKNLKHDSKLDLIAKLSESLKTGNKNDDSSLNSLFGAYKSEETAEEIVSSIRTSRTSNRKIESL